MSCQVNDAACWEQAARLLPTRHHECPIPRRTPAQERIWFLEQAYPGHARLRVASGARIVGPLCTHALQNAIDRVFARHDVLRSSFGAPPQTLSATRPELTVDSLSEAPGSAAQALACQRWIAVNAGTPQDLGQPPLLRAHLLRLADTEHLLLLCAHRYICDEEALDLLLGEIANSLDGSLPDGPSIPTFADFVAWQEAQQTTLLTHWRERLVGATEVLELPTDRARPAIQGHQGASLPLPLPGPLVDRLRALAARHALDLPGVFLAAFAALLQRYSGQNDLVIGLRSSYRAQAPFSRLVGPLDNILVLRLPISADAGTDTLLQRCGEALADARAHAGLPFERLIEALQPSRTLGYAPICQMLFDYRTASAATLPAGAVTLHPFAVDLGSADHDLSLRVDDDGDHLVARLIYDPALFDETTLQRIAGHYLNLLDDLAADTRKPAATLHLLGDSEWRQLVDEWNATDGDYPADSSLARLFEIQADRSPDAPAILGVDTGLSYRELDQRSSQLAHHLRQIGVGHETLVGVSMERSPELFVSVLAILKAGGCYVPIDPGYPRQRVSAMLEDSAVALLLTKTRWLAVLPPHHAEVLCLDRDWPAIARQASTRPLSPAGAASLCYVVFTSGSTGRPKGVLVEQRQLLNRLAWMWREYPFVAGDVSACKTALNFVDSLWELLGPLLHGVPSVLIPQQALLDPQNLVALLAEYRVTRMMLVPSLLRMLLDAHEVSNAPNQLAARLPLLREWCIGGEPLSTELARRFARALPGRLLLNLYGLSEAFDACFFDAGQLADRDTLVPIGRPLANVQAYILDAHRQPVPVGVIGELYVGGAGLARGYLGSPELSTEKFIPNPFRKEAGARIYRTGDLARYRANGLIDYLGRSDHQVKIRGFRIETDDVGSVLCSHPDILEAVIVARPDAHGELALAAYYVARTASALAAGTLQPWLRERLPEYMVPSSYTALAALPLTPSGKVDRLSLPAPDNRPPAPAAPYLSPDDATEQAIAAIWQAVLMVERVGSTDNFFELGGTSLRMVEVNRRLCEHLHRAIPVLQMYQYPTVQSLARSLNAASGLSPASPPAIQAGRDRAVQRREMQNRRQTAGRRSPS
ncbi:MAG: amino acid adenylation domain-containing protein [Candidatus Accumulibacter cognatus]|uniref:Amino acid adenylation domain-containing protein n=1 Tax=Candidatus Accumulibacter cognatus TaxID=2954383 RepID=A0A7D5N9N1_9PROT|nr:MAG: amino acid adenylation domain-containing protein [Candidatus Accumulibacter cognatus]